ncbi:MAG: 2-oxoacid:acceptor oxidoreductase subunit alpha [Candidatus Micrarchaeota archaeon]
MKTNNFTFKAGGEAGTGIATMGEMFAKIGQRNGLFAFMENEYPSLIRGGHNTITVRVSDEKIWALHGKVDILVALDKRSIEEHYEEMEERGVVVYDSEKVKGEEIKIKRKDIRFFPVPLSKIAHEAGGEIYFNQAAMGAIIAILGVEPQVLYELIGETFGKKGEEVIEKNMEAARKGFEFVKSIQKTPFDIEIKPRKNGKTLFLNGNDAVCIGAMKAGVKLIAEYPMSPSSSILHWMAAHAVKYDIVVKHTEDEIAAINYLLGAGFAGVRAMTATSGGGFSLMTEALGNGGIAEIPCVIVNVQRAGPSTGIPTYTEQGDLQFMLHASQGEFPRILCMPGDVEEAFYETFNVFNMAELVQTPAIMLLDKYLGESSQVVEYFDMKAMHVKRGKLLSDEQMEGAKNFKRHKLTKSGISPRCLPGQRNGIYVASSYEHDETGYTDESGENRIAQINKRARKMKSINPNLYQPAFYGNAKSTFLLVSWGSTKGVVLEAMKLLEKENISIRFMHIKYASPFASDTIKQALQAASKAMICECNSEGQMRNLIREKTGILIENKYLKYDARPFEAEDIVKEVKKLIGK